MNSGKFSSVENIVKAQRKQKLINYKWMIENENMAISCR